MNRLLATLILLLASSSAYAQVAYDSSTQGSVLGSATLTLNHSTSGSDRFACVGFTWYGNPDVSAVTYGATAMTATIPTISYSGESRLKAALYCIIDPPISSTAVSVTLTDVVDFIAGGVVSFSNVDQTTPNGTPVTTEGSTGPASINLTLEAGEIGLDIVAGTFSALEGSGDQTSRVEVENPGGNDSSIGMGTLSGEGQVTFEWALTQVVNRFVHGAVAIKPASAAPDITATKLIFGSQPGNIVVGQVFGAFTVRAVDDDDALDEEFEGEVSIALQTGEGSLSGTTTQSAVGGVATFDDISIRTLNEDAVIRASADGLVSADSDEFDVTAGGEGGTAGMPATSQLGGMLQ